MSCGSTTCTPSVPLDSYTHAATRRALHVPSPFAWGSWRAYDRWQQRHALLELDDRLLADIGLTREDALREARKPFWR